MDFTVFSPQELKLITKALESFQYICQRFDDFPYVNKEESQLLKQLIIKAKAGSK